MTQWLTLDDLYEETVGDWLEVKLHKAALDGEISWTNVCAILDVVERYGWLAENLSWAIYQDLHARSGEASMAENAPKFDRDNWLKERGAQP